MAGDDRPRKATRLTRLSDLGAAFAAKSARERLARAKAGDLAALETVARSASGALQAEDRRLLASHCYEAAKVALAKRHLPAAEEHLARAHTLMPDHPLFVERLRLLGEAIRLRHSVAWRTSLHNLQRDLGVMCVAAACRCSTHYEIARCQGLTEVSFDQHAVAQTIDIYTVSPYRPYSHRGKWTALLQRIKHEPFDPTPLLPMADVLADFVFEATPLLRFVDMIVPIPAAPRKFVARGFAPNDLVGRRLSERLALPVHDVLRRQDGTDTLEATYQDLAGQFTLEARRAQQLKGLSILLVEDIWTKGRTIPICAAKLRACAPAKVFAVALGRTRH
jgi:hypothetical protein